VRAVARATGLAELGALRAELAGMIRP